MWPSVTQLAMIFEPKTSASPSDQPGASGFGDIFAGLSETSSEGDHSIEAVEATDLNDESPDLLSETHKSDVVGGGSRSSEMQALPMPGHSEVGREDVHTGQFEAPSDHQDWVAQGLGQSNPLALDTDPVQSAPVRASAEVLDNQARPGGRALETSVLANIQLLRSAAQTLNASNFGSNTVADSTDSRTTDLLSSDAHPHAKVQSSNSVFREKPQGPSSNSIALAETADPRHQAPAIGKASNDISRLDHGLNRGSSNATLVKDYGLGRAPSSSPHEGTVVAGPSGLDSGEAHERRTNGSRLVMSEEAHSLLLPTRWEAEMRKSSSNRETLVHRARSTGALDPIASRNEGAVGQMRLVGANGSGARESVPARVDDDTSLKHSSGSEVSRLETVRGGTSLEKSDSGKAPVPLVPTPANGVAVALGKQPDEADGDGALSLGSTGDERQVSKGETAPQPQLQGVGATVQMARMMQPHSLKGLDRGVSERRSVRDFEADQTDSRTTGVVAAQKADTTSVTTLYGLGVAQLIQRTSAFKAEPADPFRLAEGGDNVSIQLSHEADLKETGRDFGRLGADTASQVAKTLSQPIRTALQAGTSVGMGDVEVELSPAELGRVRLSFTSSDVGVQVVVAAERPETAEMIRRHLNLLTEDLRSQGFERLSVDVQSGQTGRGGASSSNEFSEEVPFKDSPTDRHSAGGATDALVRPSNTSGVDLRL